MNTLSYFDATSNESMLNGPPSTLTPRSRPLVLSRDHPSGGALVTWQVLVSSAVGLVPTGAVRM